MGKIRAINPIVPLTSVMNFADCYRILGLRTGASYYEIKAAYRRLAREYHPDANPADDRSGDKFIQLTEAYKKLLNHVPPEPLKPSGSKATGASTAQASSQTSSSQASSTQASPSEPGPEFTFKVKVTRKSGPGRADKTAPSEAHTTASANSEAEDVSPVVPQSAWPTVQFDAELSEIDRKLKQQAYEQLQKFLKGQRFPRAIALVEGLAQRLPDDVEVKQWQAITYQRWGRQLINQKQFDKARVYLKKALKVDPHNQTLWAEVEKEFQRLEQVY